MIDAPSSRLKRERRSAALLWVGLVVVGLFVMLGVFAPWIAPHDPVKQNISNMLLPPSGKKAARRRICWERRHSAKTF
jgi:ABC-type antimicrobial peptide transport system permease subunit